MFGVVPVEVYSNERNVIVTDHKTNKVTKGVTECRILPPKVFFIVVTPAERSDPWESQISLPHCDLQKLASAEIE
jgi:hypothetical protein